MAQTLNPTSVTANMMLLSPLPKPGIDKAGRVTVRVFRPSDLKREGQGSRRPGSLAGSAWTARLPTRYNTLYAVTEVDYVC